MNCTYEQTQIEARREASALTCPACATRARREDAQFCATCGRSLSERFYAPADALLASYHQQRVPMAATAMMNERGPGDTPRGTRKRTTAGGGYRFAFEQNLPTLVAFTFIFFSLVPYLGIMFCPVVVIAGGFGVLTAQRASGTRGRSLAVCCIVVGLLLAGAQYILWWAF